MRKSFPWPALWMMALSCGVARGQATSSLEVIESEPSMLTAPGDLQGDFDIAATPPGVRFAVLPNQWEGARLWSSWGDAVLASDGNYYVSIGDHGTMHGHTLIYRVNPSSGEVAQVIDVTALLGAPDDKYAPGKIHAPLVDTGDGALHFFTYQGSIAGTTAEAGYVGDPLIRFDLATGNASVVGIPIAHSSGVVTEFHSPSRRLYGLTVPGKTMDPMRNQFFVYSMDDQKVVFCGGPEPQLARAMILGPDGRAWYGSNGELIGYDPQSNEVKPTGVKLPGDGTIRAASDPDSSGTVYGITKDGVVFAFDTATLDIKVMGPAFVAGPLYTAVCRLDPTGRYLYYLPGAHGRSSQVGTPVIQLDVKTGRRKVIAFLHAALLRQRSYHLGGTYGIALSGNSSQLLINFNGAPADRKKPDFGLCSVVVLDIPASERGASQP